MNRRRPRASALLALALASAAAAPARAQAPGDPATHPLPAMVAGSLEQSVRALVLDPGRTKIRVMAHFPGGAGENGRICGEIVEPDAGGERVRTFVATYTRAGRVLARLEDGPFSDFVARDSVFRHCSPRL